MEKQNEINYENNFFKIKLFHDYFSSKKLENINIHYNDNKKYNNIYIKYIENRNIIYQSKGDINNENLKSFFNELNLDMENGNNIIFPFIGEFHNLVDAYIESDLDDINQEKDNISESNYLKIFSKLKNNIFINKKVIFPIYNYFSNLYDTLINLDDLKIEDELFFKKLNKIVKLFEIFYERNIGQKNLSSICLIGGNLYIEFDDIFKFNKNHQIEIIIKILSNDYINQLNDNSNLLKVGEEEIKYKELKKNSKIEKLKEIKAQIQANNLYIKYIFEKTEVNFGKKIKIKEVKSIFLLEDFYGQVSSIEVVIEKDKNKIKYKFLPISIRSEKYIYYFEKIVEENKKNASSISIPKLKISNKNFVNVNYINYNDTSFDFIDYFGGVIQLLPFYKILKILNRNNDIKPTESFENLSNTIFLKYENAYKDIINDFFNYLIKIILNKLFSSKKSKKLFKKYACFIFYLILDLNLELTVTENDFKIEKNSENISDLISPLIMIYHNQQNPFFANIKEELQSFLDSVDEVDKENLKLLEKPKKAINQIYHQYMKKLFIFNNLWSKRNVFYPKRCNNNINKSYDIKYKQINYYTKNFQLPFLNPILEYKKYYPKFSKYKGQLFKENYNNILEYDFKIETNEKIKNIYEILFLRNNQNHTHIYEKCCLVKNTHHVNGILSLIYKNKKNQYFNLIFISNSNISKDENCNKSNFIKNIEVVESQNIRLSNILEDFNPHPEQKHFNFGETLCYGSIFPCPEREYKRNICINSKYILFLLIRVYFHRVSAIEIFTINKSYYFNFQNQFEINNVKTNKILNEIKNNIFFKEIKIKKDKLTLGYYNIKYKPYLFPLFEDKIFDWDNKVNYFCNYDTLIMINLFSNRSFRDIFQYPVFPTFYNLINLERQMNEHIGFQEITLDSIKRKDLFLKIYITKKDDDLLNSEMFLFNIYYSNPAFLFNYLLRVFPYTLLHIEYQGENFDNPNRLFNSFEHALNNSLIEKTDLREMIPEFFYMIELFYNKNNILFEKPTNKREIDFVLIKNKDMEIENKLHFIEKIQNIAKFLGKMRKDLEEEVNLNEWIDLIFGINQKYYFLNDKEKFQYYNECSETKFKNDESILKNNISLELVEFGLLPFQLLNKEFPTKTEINDNYIKELNKLNEDLFIDEHIEVNSPINTFICKGAILINNDYIRKIDPNRELNKFDNFFNFSNTSQSIGDAINYIFQNCISLLDLKYEKKKDIISFANYYFIGDIFGNILIYEIKEKEKEKNEDKKENEEEKERAFSFEIITKEEIDNLNSNKRKNIIDINPDLKFNNYELKIKLIKKLCNHENEIKYIDFNSRLNILLSYSLDEFINIYIFPKLKLINVIDTNSFREKNDHNYFDKVVLISFPFPSIVCYNKEYIYLLSINGELIKYEKLEEGEIIVFSIDKNLGIVGDSVKIYNSLNELKSTFNLI